MTTIFDVLCERFHELHIDLIRTIKDLPQEALEWVPGSEMNSINVLVTHLTGAETYLFGVALDEPPERDRDAEFKVHGLSADDLTARLERADETIHRGLQRLATLDAGSLHLSPRSGKQVTAGWCILHSLDHTALHCGHVQLTRQLWEQRKE